MSRTTGLDCWDFQLFDSGHLVKSTATKLRLQAAINRRPEERRRRVKLIQARRKKGIYGKGGPDVGHTKNGKTSLVNRHRNRSANGKGGRSRFHA